MRNIRVLTSILILVTCTSVFAQPKKIPGYYINLQGDSIRGYFTSYSQWNRNPSLTEFSITGTDNRMILTPDNTQKFIVEGHDEYLGYKGQRLLNPIEDALLDNQESYGSLNDSTQMIQTFLRLAKRTAEAELYVLNDGKRFNLFYRLPGQSPVELRYKKALIKNRVNEMAEYRQQLDQLFSPIIEQKNLSRKLQKLAYKESDMVTFLESLFPGEKQVQQKVRKRTEWFGSAGISMNNLRMHMGKNVVVVPKEYGLSYSPLLSAGAMIPLRRNFGKYFIHPKLSLFRYKHSGEEPGSSFRNAVTYQADLVALLGMNAGINLMNRPDYRLFLSAGVGSFLQASPKEIKKRFYYDTRIPDEKEENKLPTTAFVMETSAGILLKKKIVITATYIFPTSIATYTFYNPKLSSAQLQVGYKLSTK